MGPKCEICAKNGLSTLNAAVPKMVHYAARVPIMGLQNCAICANKVIPYSTYFVPKMALCAKNGHVPKMAHRAVYSAMPKMGL